MPPQQRTILLVDDDHEIVESMRTILENKGYRILVARDGNSGLMVAERENPDLLVLDMMMPKKSGFLVLEKLKSRPGGLIPTIMITGNEGSRHRAYAEMLGVRDYIRKPFAMEKLVRAIERVLGLKTGGVGRRRLTGSTAADRAPAALPGRARGSALALVYGTAKPSARRMVVRRTSGSPMIAVWSSVSMLSKSTIPRSSSL